MPRDQAVPEDLFQPSLLAEVQCSFLVKPSGLCVLHLDSTHQVTCRGHRHSHVVLGA